MENSNSMQLVPYIKIEYFEYEKRIEKPVEFCSDSIIIDGFFFPTGSNRLSLGYQISLNRQEETIKYLKNFGLIYSFVCKLKYENNLILS